MRRDVEVEEDAQEMWRERGVLAEHLDEPIVLQGRHD